MTEAEHPSLDPDVASLLSRIERGEEVPTLEVLARNPRFLDEQRRASERALASLPREGETLGDFHLVRQLGRGGMGVVYEAEQRSLGRRVALKILLPRAGGDEELRKRFQREAESVSELSHPDICTVHATGVTEGIAWIAMRLIEGRSLAALLAGTEGVPAPVEQLRRVGLLAGAAHALASAHDGGVLHRDLKPGNLMLEEATGRLVLLDFGLARVESSDASTLTESGDRLGTPAYMAPEQICGRSDDLDQRTDVYALGLCLFEAVTGVRPFRGPTQASLFRAILDEGVPDVRTHAPRIPRDLATIVATATAREPHLRYASAAALAGDLDAYLRGDPILARPPSVPERLQRWVARHPGATALLVLLALSLGGAGLLVGRIAADREQVARARAIERADGQERKLEQAFLALGEFRSADAQVLFRELVNDPAIAAEAWAGLLIGLRRDGEPEQILALAPELPEAVAQRPAIQRILRFARMQSGVTDEAAPERQLTQRDAIDHFLSGQEAMLAYLKGLTPDPELALREYRRAVTSAPRARALFHIEYASAAVVAGSTDEREHAVRTLQRIWPDRAHTWLLTGLSRMGGMRGRSHLAGGVLSVYGFETPRAGQDVAGACEAFERALSIDPDLTHARNNLALACFLIGRHEEARVHFMEIARRHPERAGSWLGLGNLEARLKNFEAAEKHFAKGLERAPEDAELLLRMAVTLRLTGRFEEALAFLDRLVKVEPDRARTWEERVRVLSELQRPGEVLAAIEREVAAGSLRPEAHYSLGRRSQAAGDTEAALAHYKRAGELDPGFLPARKREALILARGGKGEEVLRIVDASLAAAKGNRWEKALSVDMMSLKIGMLIQLERYDACREAILEAKRMLEESSLSEDERAAVRRQLAGGLAFLDQQGG